MTSKERLDEVSAMTVAYHKTQCEPAAKPGTTWPDSHYRTDRRTAARMVDHVHAGGRQLVPVACGQLLSDDVIAGVS